MLSSYGIVFSFLALLMRYFLMVLFLFCLTTCLCAQATTQAPLDKKAQKTYQQGLENLQKHDPGVALWYFQKADKEDGGKCLPCQEQIIQIGLSASSWKAIEDAASELATEVQDPQQQAIAHHYLGMALMNEGINNHQDNLLTRAHDEFTKALSLYPPLADAVFADGKTLAYLHKDDEAKAQFEKFIAIASMGDIRKQQALLFTRKPELAREQLAPQFGLVTSDGQTVTLNGLTGKIVLVYFWATSCDSCVRNLPHLRELAKQFQNQPFVLLSISVDSDEAAWRSFLQKNDVPGLQYRDGFNGPLSRTFGLNISFHSNADNPVAGVWVSTTGLKEAIPRTFTIDADGVLQAEKLSDSLDTKLRELIKHAGGQSTGN
jgi:thiol-disulfide isomerase/thioredoxin